MHISWGFHRLPKRLLKHVLVTYNDLQTKRNLNSSAQCGMLVQSRNTLLPLHCKD